MYQSQHFLTESWLVVCPIDTVCNWMFLNHSSEPYFFNWCIIDHTDHIRGLNTVGPGQSEATGETTQVLFFFLSFFLGFRRPNLITGQWLSRWQHPMVFRPSFLFVFLSFFLGFRRPNLSNHWTKRVFVWKRFTTKKSQARTGSSHSSVLNRVIIFPSVRLLGLHTLSCELNHTPWHIIMFQHMSTCCCAMYHILIVACWMSLSRMKERLASSFCHSMRKESGLDC